MGQSPTYVAATLAQVSNGALAGPGGGGALGRRRRLLFAPEDGRPEGEEGEGEEGDEGGAGPEGAFEAKHSSLTQMRSLWSDRGGALSASRPDLHGAGQRAEALPESYDVGSTTISAVMVGSWVMQMSL